MVAYKDAQPLRRAMFERLAARTPAIRAAMAVFARLEGRAATAFVSAMAAQSLVRVGAPYPARADLLCAWAYANEARRIEALAALVPELVIGRLALDGFGTPSPAAMGASLSSLASGSFARVVSQRDFLVAARVASTIGYYHRICELVERSPARAVLVSSDANPYALALVAAAERYGRRTCFVTHGHVAPGPPPLNFDLSILDGPALRAVYERAGPVRGRVVFKGSEGRARAMDVTRLRRPLRVGVFASIATDVEGVTRALQQVRSALEPQRLLLRLHPNQVMRDPSWRRGLALRDVELSEGARPIEDDTSACDLIVAGNSSVHLCALKMGVPAVYVPGLDDAEDDYYGFVADGIVSAEMDLPALASFYADPAWAARFARFDAAYPDQQAQRDQEVAAALRDLMSTSRRASPC